MFILLSTIRGLIGGITELGLLVCALALAVYVLPIFPGFTWESLTSVLYIAGAITGTAFLSRVEDKKGVIKAFKNLLKPLHK